MALRHRVAVMALGVAVLVGTAWEFWSIPKGFLPDEDLSEISVSTEANEPAAPPGVRWVCVSLAA